MFFSEETNFLSPWTANITGRVGRNNLLFVPQKVGKNSPAYSETELNLLTVSTALAQRKRSLTLFLEACSGLSASLTR